MLVTAIVLFLFAALFGSIILTAILKDRPTPKPIVAIHGGIALIALLATITYFIVGQTDGLFMTGLVLLLIAAVGGISLMVIDLSKKPIPKLVALLHPILAVSGVVILCIFLLKHI